MEQKCQATRRDDLPAVLLLCRGLGLHHAALPASHPVVVVVFVGVEWVGWVRLGRCTLAAGAPEGDDDDDDDDEASQGAWEDGKKSLYSLHHRQESTTQYTDSVCSAAALLVLS